jgi:hypothetical protein
MARMLIRHIWKYLRIALAEADAGALSEIIVPVFERLAKAGP